MNNYFSPSKLYGSSKARFLAKEASAICFEVRIPKKKNEELLWKVPSKIYEVISLWKERKKNLVCYYFQISSPNNGANSVDGFHMHLFLLFVVSVSLRAIRKKNTPATTFLDRPRTFLQCFALEHSVYKAKHCRNVLGPVLGRKNLIQNRSFKYTILSMFTPLNSNF